MVSRYPNRAASQLNWAQSNVARSAVQSPPDLTSSLVWLPSTANQTPSLSTRYSPMNPGKPEPPVPPPAPVPPPPPPTVPPPPVPPPPIVSGGIGPGAGPGAGGIAVSGAGLAGRPIITSGTVEST